MWLVSAEYQRQLGNMLKHTYVIHPYALSIHLSPMPFKTQAVVASTIPLEMFRCTEPFAFVYVTKVSLLHEYIRLFGIMSRTALW